jgi:hypothetical protein
MNEILLVLNNFRKSISEQDPTTYYSYLLILVKEETNSQSSTEKHYIIRAIEGSFLS